MFWSSVVEAASLLSRLPISPFHVLLLSDSCLSRLLVLPRNICHTSLLNAFFPSAQVFTCQISPPFFFLYPPLTSSRCLCVRINSRRKCRSGTMAPKRTAPRRQLKQSQTPGCCRRTPIPMPAKQKRTKTKPSPFWSVSRPWR